VAIQQNGEVALDDGRQILSEYQKYLSPSGEPGLGDAFMQWVWDNQAVTTRCETVRITALADSFAEFPTDRT